MLKIRRKSLNNPDKDQFLWFVESWATIPFSDFLSTTNLRFQSRSLHQLKSSWAIHLLFKARMTQLPRSRAKNWIKVKCTFYEECWTQRPALQPTWKCWVNTVRTSQGNLMNGSFKEPQNQYPIEASQHLSQQMLFRDPLMALGLFCVENKLIENISIY